MAYLYASGRLSGINTATTAYTITYDTFGNMVSVSAGGNVLATYTYAARNGKLTRLTYGNGDYEDYTYDNLDRLVKVTYNGSTTDVFTVVYDSNGRLAKAVDGKAGITYLYEYDSLDRLIRAYQKDASGINTATTVYNAAHGVFGKHPAEPKFNTVQTKNLTEANAKSKYFREVMYLVNDMYLF